MNIDEGEGQRTDWKHGGLLKNLNLDKAARKELIICLSSVSQHFAF